VQNIASQQFSWRNLALVFVGAFVLYLERSGFLKATPCIDLPVGKDDYDLPP